MLDQEVNSKSLQQLMSFLDEMRKPEGQIIEKRFQLSFYLLPSAKDDPEEQLSATPLPRVSLIPTEAAPVIGPQLKHIALILETINFHSSKNREEHLEQQIGKLLSLCGLVGIDGFSLEGFLDADKGTSSESTHIPTVNEVRDFVTKCYSIAKSRQEAMRMVDREVGMHRYLLMSMQRGLRVTFGRRELGDSRKQLDLLQKLLKVVETLNREGKELANCTLCFSAGVSAPGQEMKMNGNKEQNKPVTVYDDAFGRIFLNSLSSPEQWIQVLRNVELAVVHQRQMNLKKMKMKEAELADRLGFRLFCADYSSIGAEEYAAFLDQLLSEVEILERHNPQALWQKDDRPHHKNLSVMVKSANQTITADSDSGVLDIPSTCTVTQILAWAQQEGPKVAAAQEFMTELRARETQLRILVKRRLRLLDLLPTEHISREDMTEFCFTLRKYSNDLAPLMQGLSIHASNKFAIHDDGSLYLPWNFY